MSRARHAERSQAAGSNLAGSKWGILRSLFGALRVQGTGAPTLATPDFDARVEPHALRRLSVAWLLIGMLIVPATASAEKTIGGFVGGPSGALGGQFNQPRDIAVNEAGMGGATAGDIYVLDSANSRVQVFSSTGAFKFAIGRDVIFPGATDAFEKCTVAADCKAGSNGTDADAPAGEIGAFANSLTIDQDTGNVIVAERNNARVEVFTATGAFVRAWGFDVIDGTTGAPNDNGTGFEVCDVTNSNTMAQCKRGLAGSSLGQFGINGNAGTLPIAVSPPDGAAASGKVYVGDSNNRRVNIYNLDGSAPESFGTATDFTAAGFPRAIAVDSRGIVYASQAGSPGQIVRYDSLNANGGGVGFLAPITSAALGGAGIVSLEGLEVDPDSDGAGPDEDVLYVLRDPDAATVPSQTTIRQLGPVNDPGPTAAPTTSDVIHMPSEYGANTANGSGINTATGFLYVLGTAGSNGHGVYFLSEGGASPTIAATAGLASDVTTSSATLNGTIDPDGLVTYTFRLSKDGVSFTTAGSGVVSGSSPQSVSVNVTGLDPNTTYRYSITAQKTTGTTTSINTTTGEAIFLTDAAAPTAITLGATSVRDSAATLQGSVNPSGSTTSYHFEYGRTASYGRQAPLPSATAGSGASAVAVAQDVGALDPDTTYHYRVCATNPTGTVCGSDVSFVTQSAAVGVGSRAYERVSPASVGGVGVGQWYSGPGKAVESGFAAHEGERFMATGFLGSMLVDGGMAWANDIALSGRISDQAGWVSRSAMTHPNHGAASHRLVSARAAAPDLSTFTVHAQIGPLRMFPEMEGWSDSSGAPSFVGDWDARWEIVDMADHSYSEAVFNGTSGGLQKSETLVSGDGRNVVTFGRYHGLAGPTDPASQTIPDRVSGRSIYLDDISGGLSDDFDGAGVHSLVNACTAGTMLPDNDAGVLEERACPAPLPGRSAHLISDRGAALHSEGTLRETFSVPNSLENIVSRDGSRMFFLSPDPFGSDVPSVGCTGGGDTTLCAPQLYVRQRNTDGSVSTRWISRAAPGVFGSQSSSLIGPAYFEGASPDGGVVFFRTNSSLTGDDPNAGSVGAPSNGSWDLYRYELPAGPDGDPATPDADPAGGTLTRISRGPTGTSDCNSPFGGSADGSGVSSAALRFVSKDGDRVYFTCADDLVGVPVGANGTITSPGGTPTTPTTVNLYLYEDDGAGESWRFVAQLPRSTDSKSMSMCASTGAYDRAPIGPEINSGPRLSMQDALSSNCVRGTEDGEFVTFWTDGRLTADDPDPSTGDLYAFDATADELTRISRPQGGDGGAYHCSAVAPVVDCFGDPGAAPSERNPLAMLGVVTRPGVSGQRTAFFQSASRLVAEDGDDAYDVYQWRDGELSLFTPGTETDTFYKGNSADGLNVYFATRDRLSWQDTDAVLDVYTARIGGGIPEPPAPAAVCSVLAACQGGGAAATMASDARTTFPTVSGGNASDGARKALSIGAVGSKARKRAARTGWLALRVRTTAAGELVVVARGKVGGRARVLARASKRVGRPGVTTVDLRLSATARKALRQGRRLSLSIRVHQPGVRSRSIAVALKRGARS